MLNAILKKSTEITDVSRTGNSLVLTSEIGKLRLKPQNKDVIRLSYTQRAEFIDYIGIGIEKENDFSDWTYSETDTTVCLSTQNVTANVNKKTLSVTYFDADGKLLLAEKAFESHVVDSFDAQKTVVDENTKIEEVETPDGKKRTIKEATTIFDRDMYHTQLNLTFQDDEKLYGLGQAEEGCLNLRGTTQYLHPANLKISIPFILSTKGYGLLLSTGSSAIFNDNAYGSYFYTQADLELDYYFIKGENFDKLVKEYRFLTGKAAMLSRWAFGFWQSQERYETQKEILQVAKEHRDRQIGIDAIVLDWESWTGKGWGQKTFDLSRFPNAKAMTDELHDENIRFLISVWPNMHETTANYNEFLDKNLLLPASQVYNAFVEDGRALYWKQANEGLFVHGIDGWWCDSTEPFCPEWGGPLKQPPAIMYKNYVDVSEKMISTDKTSAFGLVHSKALYDGQRNTTTEKRVVNLTRSSYTGGQKYGAVLWSGDTYASWQVLQNQIVAGLNFCASGLPYWTLDIGGFFVKNAEKWFWNGRYNETNKDLGYQELFTRWYQLGAFLPIFRSHGTDTRREMWLYDGDGGRFYNAMINANRLRYSLIPYIYSLAGKVWLEDYTILRMLAFDFADDETATNVKDQFMFGNSLLVCPATTPMYYTENSTPVENAPTTKQVYLPKGADWYDFYTNELYKGGQFITVGLTIDNIPLFVKAGSILPMTKPLQSTEEVASAKIELHIYKGCDCSFNLYEDSGDGYGYENGEYDLTKITWNNTAEEVNISENAGRFDIVIH